MLCRRFRSIPGLYALDVSSNPSLVVATKKVFRNCETSPGRKLSLVKNHCFQPSPMPSMSIRKSKLLTTTNTVSLYSKEHKYTFL